MGWQQLVVGTYLLGRSKDCDIVVPSNRASRRLARLTVTESAAWVEDLGSANGTHVNGIPIKGRQELHHQDFLGVGAGALEVSMEQDEGAARAEVLHPRSTIPPPQDATNEATIGASDDEGPEHAIEGWADGVLAAARAGQLDDARIRRSAMQFGIQRASGRRAARWVDFVVELASLGIALELERARLLTAAIDRVGVDATLADAYLARLRALPTSPEQQALCAEVEGWRAKARHG